MSLPSGVRDAREKPAENLPIATNPAMFAPAVGAEVGWVIVDDFDVREQRSPRIGTLDQVVAQDGVGWETLAKDFAKDINVINPFSGENAFSEKSW